MNKIKTLPFLLILSVLLNIFLLFKPDSNVLFYTSEDLTIVEATAGHHYAIGSLIGLMYYPTIEDIWGENFIKIAPLGPNLISVNIFSNGDSDTMHSQNNYVLEYNPDSIINNNFFNEDLELWKTKDSWEGQHKNGERFRIVTDFNEVLELVNKLAK